MTIEDKVMLFLVANSNIVGGFNKLAPTAKVNDGFFDVFILRKCNIAELARVMSLVPRGLHINDPKVFHFKAESLKVTTKENIQLNLDGEFGGVSPCEFKVLKNHIKVITGKKK
jgi:diacylglycerol kinase (ATP)